MRAFLLVPACTLFLALLTGGTADAGILEDRAIEDAITGSYVMQQVVVDRSMIQFYVRNAAIEVRGQAADETERTLIGDFLAQIPGVLRVENRLFVDSAPKRLQPQWRARQIRAELKYWADIDATEVSIEPAGGHLRLSGTLADRAAIALVEDRVRLIAPEAKWVNEIQLAAPSGTDRLLDDPSIAAMVLRRLAITPGLTALQVTSQHGAVELTGLATSAAAREALTQAARQVRGVKAVHNRVGVTAPSS